MHVLKKLYRYARMYDVNRALIKAIGRMRTPLPLYWILAPLKFSQEKDIAMIGCGQFAFSTIAFFLTKRFGRRIGMCLDIDEAAATSFARCYGIPHQLFVLKDDLSIPSIKLAYIASNHASHTDYAVYFLERGVSVYIEKPVSVSMAQLAALKTAVQKQTASVYFGYNRPFSGAIQELVARMNDKAFTLNCTVIGHFIPDNHWYRHPEEGTRVCGNLGHWIDLAVHLLQAKASVSRYDITVSYANLVDTDDNLTVVLSTERGDLITLTLTSREEPFEGIHETIIFQQENLFVKIDDFRKAEFQQGAKKHTRKYRPKDVGHERAVMQPFFASKRDMGEVFLSTELMLHIMDMVKNKITKTCFDALKDEHG